jgi:hypothetical protein
MSPYLMRICCAHLSTTIPDTHLSAYLRNPLITQALLPLNVLEEIRSYNAFKIKSQTTHDRKEHDMKQ